MGMIWVPVTLSTPELGGRSTSPGAAAACSWVERLDERSHIELPPGCKPHTAVKLHCGSRCVRLKACGIDGSCNPETLRPPCLAFAHTCMLHTRTVCRLVLWFMP